MSPTGESAAPGGSGPTAPRLIAHRGSHGPGGPLENTLAAFEAAVRDAADMVELDVWQTADGALVIYHDDALPGIGIPIAAMDLPALGRHPLANGRPPPLLADALALLRGRVPVNVEIKHGAALQATLGLVRDLRMEGDVLLSSFDLDAMERAADAAPDIARALIMGTETLDPCVRFRESFPFWRLRRAGAVAWHPAAILISRPLVEALHAQGIAVSVWTVNDAADVRRLAAMGVDAVFTDRPGALRRALAEGPSPRRSAGIIAYAATRGRAGR